MEQHVQSDDQSDQGDINDMRKYLRGTTAPDNHKLLSITDSIRLSLLANPTKQIYDTYIVALSKAKPCDNAQLVQHAQQFVTRFPEHGPAYLHRALAYIACGGDVLKALVDAWIVLLWHDMDDKAVRILKRCARDMPYVGLDLGVDAISKMGEPLSWSNLSEDQKRKHFSILKSSFIPCSWWRHGTHYFSHSGQPLPPDFNVIVPGKLFTSCGNPCNFLGLRSVGVSLIVEALRHRERNRQEDANDIERLALNLGRKMELRLTHIDALLVKLAMAKDEAVLLSFENRLSNTAIACYLLLFGQSGVNSGACTGCMKSPDAQHLFLGSCSLDTCALSPRIPLLTVEEACALLKTTELDLKFINQFNIEVYRRHSLLHQARTSKSYDRKCILYPSLVGHTDKGGGRIDVEGEIRSKPKLIVMCGAPGSGKSQLASKLNCESCSQDELGSKQAVAHAVANVIKNGGVAIVDRCNPTAEERKDWIGVAFGADAVIVYVKTDEEVCVERARLRPSHETVAPSFAKGVVRGFFQRLQVPARDDIDSGYMAVVTIHGGWCEGDVLKRLWMDDERDSIQRQPVQREQHASKGVESTNMRVYKRRSPSTFRLENFHKYPRTRHLIALGTASVTPDDLVSPIDEIRTLLNLARHNDHLKLTIEEKVDGANIGFSIDEESGEIRAQNRSHFVNAKSHQQFHLIRHFIQTYEEDLRFLLQGQLVLYGEWMYATHSIAYTHLPSVFLAFDLFDAVRGKFYSRSAFAALIEKTQLAFVGDVDVDVHDGVSEEALIDMATAAKSRYYDGIVEGIVVRVDDLDWLVDKAKIVRPDFIAGDQHWTSRPITRNRFHAL